MSSLLNDNDDDRVSQAKTLSKTMNKNTKITHKLIVRNKNAKTALRRNKNQINQLVKAEKSIKSLQKEKLSISEIKLAKVFAELFKIAEINEIKYQTLLQKFESLAAANSIFQQSTMKDLYKLQILETEREDEQEKTLHTFVHTVSTPDSELLN